MDRFLAISLSLSVAAHLVVGGLASQHEPADTPDQVTLSVTLRPVTASAAPASSKTVAITEPTTHPSTDQQPTAAPPIITSPRTATAVLRVSTTRSDNIEHHTQPNSEQRVSLAANTHAEVNTAATLQQDAAQAANEQLARQQIQQGIHRLFNTHFYYPRIAQQRGIEGTVHIGLHISADGTISNIHLARGSGTDILDRAAINSAQKISVYPDSIRLLNNKEIDLVMPVKFQLTSG